MDQISLNNYLGIPKQIRVLVVDDEPAVRTLLCSQLHSLGFDSTEADGGHAALASLESELSDIVLVDLYMPGMDGIALICALRQQYPHLPVVVVSGAGTLSEAVDAMKLGAFDYIEKPLLDMAQIDRVIRKSLEEAARRAAASSGTHGLENLVMKRTEQLRFEENRYRMLFESAHDAIVLMKNDQILDCNRSALELFGARLEDMQGKELLQFSPMMQPDDLYSEDVYALFRDRVLLGRPQHFDWRFKRAGGYSFDAEISLNGLLIDGQNYFQALIRDVSERKRYLEELYNKANYDDLSGLPNRNLLTRTMSNLIDNLSVTGGTFHLFLIDISKLQHVNDTFGHARGDELIQMISERLKPLMTFKNSLSRFIGNEFMLLSTGLASDEQAYALAQRILDLMEQPFIISNIELFISASVGVCSFPGDGSVVETLLKNAEAAMYQAKSQRVGSIQFYNKDISNKSKDRLQLENRLHRALEREEFHLNFQPQIDVTNGAVIGAEVLLRWVCPENGMVSPLRFIPVLEESGLIIPVGNWVIKSACQQMRRWIDRGMPSVEFSVNVSPLQFLRGQLVETVKSALAENSLNPSLLCLELTESLIMNDVKQALEIMRQLVDLGVSLSIDDFGTGYSSLSYLSRMPINEVKIDRSFVIDIPGDSQANAIVDTILGMASCLGLRVVAEGVETEDQRNYLSAKKCDRIQGYFYSKPLPPDKFEAFMFGRLSP